EERERLPVAVVLETARREAHQRAGVLGRELEDLFVLGDGFLELASIVEADGQIVMGAVMIGSVFDGQPVLADGVGEPLLIVELDPAVEVRIERRVRPAPEKEKHKDTKTQRNTSWGFPPSPPGGEGGAP